ncbi:MAG: class I SAM-dependent methyltransferase [Alphaproteobacteria bacterium]
MFEAAEAYERDMGHWSKKLAPLFLDFVGVKVGDHVLDVGCGTGSLTFCLGQTTGAAKIVGIDPSEGFIEYARAQNHDSRVTFDIGDARSLPYADGSFDVCVASLIMGFIPDALKAACEMRRVTRPGGLVATCFWDTGGAMQNFEFFWNNVTALDPTAEPRHWRHLPNGTAAALSNLWCEAALTNVATAGLPVQFEFDSFAAYWRPLSANQGPPGAYLATLSQERREALKNKLREQLIGDGADRALTFNGKAWAVKGMVL